MQKDNFNPMSHHDIVYKIYKTYYDRNVTYIRQTKRQLRMRIQEYNFDINKKIDFNFLFCHF